MACLLAILLAVLLPAFAARAATIIENTAELSFRLGTAPRTLASNRVTLSVDALRSPASANFLRLAPVEGDIAVPGDASRCRLADGSATPVGTGGRSGSAAGPQSLTPALSFRPGDMLYIIVEDADRNLDPAAVDTVDAAISTSGGDAETLVLVETGPGTGRFTGGMPTSSTPPPVPRDCALLLQSGDTVTLTYVDAGDPEDRVSLDLLVDPVGFVFDSATGAPVDGARVTLIDADTGEPADVFGDDGVSAYPSTVLTGAPVEDASGESYPGTPGAFRFPFVRAGNYRLLVEPPAGFAFPSAAAPAQLAALTAPDGDAFVVLEDGSYGLPFTVAGPQPLRVDIPIDPAGGDIVVRKTASVGEAEAGDFVEYMIETRNVGDTSTAAVTLVDAFPAGSRLAAGSVRVEGGGGSALDADGDRLSLDLGRLAPGAARRVSYVLQVGAAAPVGLARNSVQAFIAGAPSGNPAVAAVRVRAPLFTDAATIVGRVAAGACGVPEAERIGVAGVRVVMEDGRYTITDRDGLYHFEGVDPGTHVVQLDLGTLPPGHAPLACTRNSRRAGRSFSTFVEVGGGALWREDFTLAVDETRTVAASGDALPGRLSDPAAAGGETDWLAGAEPGTAILFPEPGHNPRAPAQRLVVRHLPGHVAEALINGAPASPHSFEGKLGGDKRGVEISSWRALPLNEGRNQIEVLVRGPDGGLIERLRREVWFVNTPAHAAFVPEQSRLIADGRTRARLALRITDASGRPVRSGVTGSLVLSPPYVPAADVDTRQARELAGMERHDPTWTVHGDDGIAYVELEPTTVTGTVQLGLTFQAGDATYGEEIEAWLEPGEQQFILVGYAAGSHGHRALTRRAEPFAGTSDSVTDGEVKLYAKGRVLGKWLLTLAVDSEREERRPGERRRLLGSIDPDRYYTVYGDGSQQRFDAPSSDRLYLRLEREQFYALYGDFETGLDRTQLARYSRTLTGVKVEYRGDVLAVNGFAADTALGFGRDEIEGNGLSGPYRLSSHDIVVGSDKVVIEIRDRFRSDVVLSRAPQVRHIDYDIDYLSGTIRFREPVLSRDENLNPRFIIVDYETEGLARQHLNAGGRASARLLGGRAELGASFIRDEDDAARTDLYGADLRVRVRDTTEIRAEYAHSDSEAGTLGGTQGTAWQVEADHHGERVDVSAYVRHRDAGFGVGQLSAAESGTRKYGVDARVRLADELAATASVYREAYLIGPARRDQARIEAEWRPGDSLLRAGFRFVDDIGRDGLPRSSRLATFGASHDFLKSRLTLDADAEIALGGADSSVDFPSRYALGARYRLSSVVQIVAGHEIADGETFEAATTHVGVDLAAWSGANLVTTLNRQDIGEVSPRTFAALGLRQSVLLGKGWSLEATLDGNRTLSGAIDEDAILNPAHPAASGGFLARPGLTEDFWAATLGATWRSEDWSWTGRLEYRDGEGDRWGLTTAALRQTRAGVALAGQINIFRTKSADRAAAISANARASAAWRPIGSRLSVLDRLEYDLQRVEQGQLPGPFSSFAGFGPGGGRSSRIVNNLALNWMGSPWTGKAGEAEGAQAQASLYWGVKYVMDRYSGEEYDGLANMLGLEARLDATADFDLGVTASVRHVAESGTLAWSFGPNIGYSPLPNAWVTLGYNLEGYDDRDFGRANHTASGAYVTFRLKLDQLSPEALFGGAD